MKTLLTPAVLVTLVCGGLAGAVFTWWVNREEPLRMSYAVTTTSTGADVTTNSLVPGLTLRIGERDIPAIHTHVIQIARDRGYADSARLAVSLPTGSVQNLD